MRCPDFTKARDAWGCPVTQLYLTHPLVGSKAIDLGALSVNLANTFLNPVAGSMTSIVCSNVFVQYNFLLIQSQATWSAEKK